MINEYILLCEKSATALSEKVNQHLKEGWKLRGKHQVTVDGTSNGVSKTTHKYHIFTQEMIKTVW